MTLQHIIRMGSLIGIGVFINKNTFEGGGVTYSKGGAYWKEGAKSNHYGTSTSFEVTCNESSIKKIGKIPFSSFLLLPH